MNAAIQATNSTANATRVRPCPLCGALDREVQARRDGWDIVECARCEMVFLGGELAYSVQAADHDWFEEHSRELAQRQRKQPLMLFLSRCTRWLRPEPTGRLLAQTLRWARSGRLVDFGCGDGRFLATASARFDVTGIELSPQGAEASRQRIAPEKIFQGPVTEVAGRDLPAAAFDIVTQFGYVEHEWHPLAGLRAAHRLLKPGGLTILKTPNYASWNRHIRGMNWCGYHVPAHCNYFTPHTLARILRETGFEPLPRRLADCLPTSDSLWMAARKV
ncbi:MAG TPA: class I SAM-dependent methyltransferase [Candidatus Acidoferrales bacterium]|jgi:SAM-dependent methyltransferase|nr:class I SAM-dependent methyltransferase [Candidatus Acidoferrales bacterium]